jgi:hypothetical protein
VNDPERQRLAAALMDGFAAATGLSAAVAPQRYLWTDAFAVCNFLGLYRASGDTAHLERALRLVDQVHRILGRHRGDDARRGWISGLGDAEAARHPTRGGLRIGKPLPERLPSEPFDPDLEWERDGQYLHYLTQWMHALHRACAETGEQRYDAWAVELALAATAAFARTEAHAGGRRLVWKMSIDLRRVLVPATGQHDALDVLVSCLELEHGAPVLGNAIEDMRRMALATGLETTDALGIGSLLLDACRLAAAIRRRGISETKLLSQVLSAARRSLDACANSDPLAGAPGSRLAFRELGLAMGIHAVERLTDPGALGAAVRAPVVALLEYGPLAARIDACWCNAENRKLPAWVSHRHINDVMLAASLLPAGYLGH